MKKISLIFLVSISLVWFACNLSKGTNKDLQDTTPTAACILRGSFTNGDPMVVGETFHMKLKVWDKNKPETELVVAVNLVVK